MADIKKSPDHQIDGRVSIALDALDDEEKRAIEGVTIDRDHFIAGTSDSRKDRRISKNDPFYALKGPSGLRIIYSRVGNDIVIGSYQVSGSYSASIALNICVADTCGLKSFVSGGSS